jgi:hypothetical protein
MLGEKLGETKGKVVGTRVVGPGAVEQSVQEQGRFLGLEVTNLVTFTMRPTAAGTLQGEAHGLLQTADGEAAPWTAAGQVTRSGPGMAVAIRGALLVQAAPHGKLARLNAQPLVFEVDVDADGSLRAQFWAWR